MADYTTLRPLRQQLGLTQTQIAAALAINIAKVSLIERSLAHDTQGDSWVCVIGTCTTGVRTVSGTLDAGARSTPATATRIPTDKHSLAGPASQEGFVSLMGTAGPTQARIQATEGADRKSHPRFSSPRTTAVGTGRRCD